MQTARAEIYADGFAVGIGLTLLPHHHGEEAVPAAKTMPTVAVGTDLPVLTVFLWQRFACWPGRNEPCADGPDILPSAHDLAVGTAARSRSDSIRPGPKPYFFMNSSSMHLIPFLTFHGP
jgi:hypothetical protein